MSASSPGAPQPGGRAARRTAALRAAQTPYFERADAARFAWTTRGPGLAETEDALLAPLLGALAAPCLEVGCGEGNNLVRLVARAACVGVDLFPAKLRFAAGQLPGVPLAAGDGAALPFRAGVFRSVVVRDLLHHVPAPERVLAEAARVLAPGGRLHLLEPNGRNPLVRLQTRLVAAEAGARRFDPAHVAALLRGLPFVELRVDTRQPLPLRRLVLHYRWGLPGLGRIALARRALAALERAAGGLLPPSRWAYVAASARRAP